MIVDFDIQSISVNSNPSNLNHILIDLRAAAQRIFHLLFYHDHGGDANFFFRTPLAVSFSR